MDEIILGLGLYDPYFDEMETLLLELQYMQTRTRNKVTKKALPKWNESPFALLFENGSDKDFILKMAQIKILFQFYLFLKMPLMNCLEFSESFTGKKSLGGQEGLVVHLPSMATLLSLLA